MAGGKKSNVKRQRSKVKGQRLKVKSQRSKVAGQRSKVPYIFEVWLHEIDEAFELAVAVEWIPFEIDHHLWIIFNRSFDENDRALVNRPDRVVTKTDKDLSSLKKKNRNLGYPYTPSTQC